jgi:RNA polymerase sigma factor (sigma-70 family)
MSFSLFNLQSSEPQKETYSPSQGLTDVDAAWEYWYPRVYGYFFKRVGLREEVEDLTSSTLTTVFTAPNIQNLQAYMWRVAHNYLVKYINTKNTEPAPFSLNEEWIAMEYKEEVEETISDRYTAKLQQLINCVNDHLTKDLDKQLVQLSIMDEKNSTEIATILNLKPDNIRQKLSRTLKKLKQKCLDLWPAKAQIISEDPNYTQPVELTSK